MAERFTSPDVSLSHERESRLTRVSILLGSDQDADAAIKVVSVLDSFKVGHKTANLKGDVSDTAIDEYFNGLDEEVMVHIVAAGVFPTLPDRINQCTDQPVINLPISSSPLEGLLLLSSIGYSTQIPSAASVGLNNQENAALLAVRMLALSDPELAERHKAYLAEFPLKVAVQNEWLQGQSDTR